MYNSNKQTWLEANFTRPPACQSAEFSTQPSAELFLYMSVTKLIDEDTCASFEEGDAAKFAGELFGMVCVVWVLCFACVCRGSDSIQYIVIITSTLPWVLLLALMGKFVAKNNEVGGKGPGYYFGEKFPLPSFGSDTVEYYDPEGVRKELLFDAFSQVFFSTSICVGVMYAYGSYNKVKKPVIADAVLICTLDFLFALIAGFIVWSAIGIL